jgi:hypothetical protein
MVASASWPEHGSAQARKMCFFRSTSPLAIARQPEIAAVTDTNPLRTPFHMFYTTRPMFEEWAIAKPVC